MLESRNFCEYLSACHGDVDLDMIQHGDTHKHHLVRGLISALPGMSILEQLLHDNRNDR